MNEFTESYDVHSLVVKLDVLNIVILKILKEKPRRYSEIIEVLHDVYGFKISHSLASRLKTLISRDLVDHVNGVYKITARGEEVLRFVEEVV
ncbi:MAG: hypothetical protein ACPL3C_07900, partial [Pyrobaculum sp.]